MTKPSGPETEEYYVIFQNIFRYLPDRPNKNYHVLNLETGAWHTMPYRWPILCKSSFLTMRETGDAGPCSKNTDDLIGYISVSYLPEFTRKVLACLI